MLKSGVPREDVQGNKEKYLSYREAWARIKQSQACGFYLEAITLVESIISDRLTSYLQGTGKISGKKLLSFRSLIEKWKETTPPITIGAYQDLQTEVDNWRVKRNKIVHGMVKSEPGRATENIINFLEEAKSVARKGEKLAKAVSNWHKQQLRKKSNI